MSRSNTWIKNFKVCPHSRVFSRTHDSLALVFKLFKWNWPTTININGDFRKIHARFTMYTARSIDFLFYGSKWANPNLHILRFADVCQTILVVKGRMWPVDSNDPFQQTCRSPWWRNNSPIIYGHPRTFYYYQKLSYILDSGGGSVLEWPSDLTLFFHVTGFHQINYWQKVTIDRTINNNYP